MGKLKPGPCQREKIICKTLTGVMYVGPLDHQQLSAGDVVKIELETEVLKLMQADHGGWNDAMATVCQLRYTYTVLYCV